MIQRTPDAVHGNAVPDRDVTPRAPLFTAAGFVFIAILSIGNVITRDLGQTAHVLFGGVVAMWCWAEAFLVWRRTPLRGMPLTQMLLGVLLGATLGAPSSFFEPLEASPVRLIGALVALIVVLALVASRLHAVDRRRHPVAYGEVQKARRAASVRDTLKLAWVPKLPAAGRG